MNHQNPLPHNNPGTNDRVQTYDVQDQSLNQSFNIGISNADIQATITAIANQQQQANAAAIAAQQRSNTNNASTMQYLEDLSSGNAQGMSNIGSILQLLNPNLLTNNNLNLFPQQALLNANTPSLHGLLNSTQPSHSQYTHQTQHSLAGGVSQGNSGEPHPPPGFELPTVQHRLDPRWQLCWYKSVEHFHNRRRYTAKCISCGYELEGRPERMARHILFSCIKVSSELKQEYLKEIERTGKVIPQQSNFTNPANTSAGTTSTTVNNNSNNNNNNNNRSNSNTQHISAVNNNNSSSQQRGTSDVKDLERKNSGADVGDDSSDIIDVNDFNLDVEGGLSQSNSPDGLSSPHHTATNKKRKRSETSGGIGGAVSSTVGGGGNLKSQGSESSLLSSLLNDAADSLSRGRKAMIGGRRTTSASSFEELLLYMFFEGSVTSLGILDFVPDASPLHTSFLFNSKTSATSPPPPSTSSSSASLYNRQSAALQDLTSLLAAEFPITQQNQVNYSKLLYKIVPDVERRYLGQLSSFLAQESKCWTVFVTSQVLMTGLRQFFILLKHAEYEVCVGTFKLSLETSQQLGGSVTGNVNPHHAGLMLERIYSHVWSRIDALSIPRQLLTYSMPCEIMITTISFAATSAPLNTAGPPPPTPLTQVSPTASSGSGNGGAATSVQSQAGVIPLPANPAPLSQSQPQQHRHFLRVDMKETDNRLISIPCLLTSLQSLLRYFATIVKPLNLVTEVYRYFLYQPAWLSAIHHFLVSRNQHLAHQSLPLLPLPLIPDTSLPHAHYFSLYHHLDTLSIYLFTMRDILSIEQISKTLPPLTSELVDMMNNPNYLIALSAYCKILKPVVEGMEALLGQERDHVTLAHCMKALLTIESSLLRVNLLNESYMNDLRSAVLNRLHEITVAYDVDLFIVSLFLWPRYKNLAMSKKYDYNAIRQGILRLANVLKCFAIDQAYQLVHEIEMYRTNTPPFSFSEEQLDLNARELWDLFPDKANVLCIIARKLFAITAISSSGVQCIERYNHLLALHHYDEVVAEKLLFMSSFHQSQVRERQKEQWIHCNLNTSSNSTSHTASVTTPSNPLSNPSLSGNNVTSTMTQSNAAPAPPQHHQQYHTSPYHPNASFPTTATSWPSPAFMLPPSSPSPLTRTLPINLMSLASRSLESVSFTWIEAEIRSIQYLHEKEGQELASGYNRTRRLSLEEVFDFAVFLQIEAIVKARQESAAARERETILLKAQEFDWDPASILADYERKNI